MKLVLKMFGSGTGWWQGGDTAWWSSSSRTSRAGWSFYFPIPCDVHWCTLGRGTELPEPFPFLFPFLFCLISSCICFCCFCLGLVVSSLVWLFSCFVLVFFSLFWLFGLFLCFLFCLFGLPFVLASLGVFDCPSHRQVNLSGWMMF